MTTAAQPFGVERVRQMLVTGEFAFTAADFREIARPRQGRSRASTWPKSKATLVYSRLAKRLRALGTRQLSRLLRRWFADDARRAQQMIAALTTNVTRFFREPHHFEHLRKRSWSRLPTAARRRRSRAALVGGLLDRPGALFDGADRAVGHARRRRSSTSGSLPPTSIRNVVAHGKEGVYQQEELRDVPAELRAKWFAPVPAKTRQHAERRRRGCARSCRSASSI